VSDSARPRPAASFGGKCVRRGVKAPLQRQDWLHLLAWLAITVFSVAVIVNSSR
jgi:hypothetical protein